MIKVVRNILQIRNGHCLFLYARKMVVDGTKDAMRRSKVHWKRENLVDLHQEKNQEPQASSRKPPGLPEPPGAPPAEP